MPDTALASIGDLALRHGGVLRDARLAYVTYGTLAQDGRNAVLLTHGYTSSHQFADGGAAAEGSWSALVGPGRAIDTDRFFVVSSNMLGSSFGSTGPGSPDPATGRPYGPDFPRLTLADIVAAQRRLLDQLGVRQLAAVVRPPSGGVPGVRGGWGGAVVRRVPGVRVGRRVPRLRARDRADHPRAAGGRRHRSRPDPRAPR